MTSARVVVLVDGSNVARCGAWLRGHRGVADPDLRRRLVDRITSWASSHDHDVVVAFDGAGPWRPGSIRVTPRVEVVGSGPAEGDDLLEQRAAELRRTRRPHWVVTSDGAVRHVAGAGADRTIASDDFVAELDVAAPIERAPVQLQPSRLVDTLDDDVRAKLERLRRGE